MGKKRKYVIEKRFIGSAVSLWVHGHPREILLSDETPEKDLAALYIMKHPAISIEE